MTSVSKNKKLAYSITELSKTSSISRGIIYAEINQGKLIARKCNSRTVVYYFDAVKWLKSLPVYKCSNSNSQEVNHD